MPVPVIPADKANHACYGALVALMALLLQKLLKIPVDPIYISMGASALTGLVFEAAILYLKKTTIAHSILNIVATALGGVAIATAILITQG